MTEHRTAEPMRCSVGARAIANMFAARHDGLIGPYARSPVTAYEVKNSGTMPDLEGACDNVRPFPRARATAARSHLDGGVRAPLRARRDFKVRTRLTRATQHETPPEPANASPHPRCVYLAPVTDRSRFVPESPCRRADTTAAVPATPWSSTPRLSRRPCRRPGTV